MTDFERLAADYARRWGPGRLVAVADGIDEGSATQARPAEVAEAKELIRQGRDRMGDTASAAYLRGLAAGWDHSGATRVEVVWSGPHSHGVPVRSTAQVLVDVVADAAHELILLTYSAKPYRPLLDALALAVGRGVQVRIVVETLGGAGSAMSGSEPAAAFASVAGLQLWHWPERQRTDAGAKMHAKVAVGDRRTLLVSSANLTQSGVGKNIEAGLLVRGGTAPMRCAEHVIALMETGRLARLSGGQSVVS